jgi:hypothetical protein
MHKRDVDEALRAGNRVRNLGLATVTPRMHERAEHGLTSMEVGAREPDWDD